MHSVVCTKSVGNGTDLGSQQWLTKIQIDMVDVGAVYEHRDG